MFKCFGFNSLKTIHDLKESGYEANKFERQNYKICIIDDNGFDKETFKRTGYINVDVFNDYTNSNQVAAYDLIACDIDGVGVELDSQKQGIAVAETIKRLFPDKIVLVYTAHNPNEYGKNYYEIADGYFAKDLSANEIAKVFDGKLKYKIDAIAAWERIEKKLKDNNISNKSISYAENVYVTSIMKHHDYFNDRKYRASLDDVLKIAEIAASLTSIIGTFIK